MEEPIKNISSNIYLSKVKNVDYSSISTNYMENNKELKTPKSNRIGSSYQYKANRISKSIDKRLEPNSSPKSRYESKNTFQNNFVKNLHSNELSKKLSDNYKPSQAYSLIEKKNLYSQADKFSINTANSHKLQTEKAYDKLEESYNKIMLNKNKPTTPREHNLYKINKVSNISGTSATDNIKNLKTMYTAAFKRDTSSGKLGVQSNPLRARQSYSKDPVRTSTNSMDFNGFSKGARARPDTRSVDSRELTYLRRLDSEHANNHKVSESSLKEDPKASLQPVENRDLILGYAANTDEGIVRNYNEDRVTIILNIVKPSSRDPKEVWPKCSYFGVYDGHGGSLCADYLRDNLHQYIIRESAFPYNPKESCTKGFAFCENTFIDMAQNIRNYSIENATLSQNNIERSGSCSLVVLIVGEMVYVANVGDSRAILSCELGTKVYPLTRDHKPIDGFESKRILENGGKIYRAQNQVSGRNGVKENIVLGPYRVLPGRLSVSRTFGDAEAKLPKFGGNPKIIVAEPEIKQFKISREFDFIVMGSDGIYDKLNNKEIVQLVWDTVGRMKGNPSVQRQCTECVDVILKTSLMRKSLDNVTVVMIAFKNLYQEYRNRQDQKI